MSPVTSKGYPASWEPCHDIPVHMCLRVSTLVVRQHGMPAGRAACRLSKCKIQVQGIDAAAKGSLPRGGNIMVVQGVREE